MNHKYKKKYNRRRFLGLSAMATAASLGSTTLGLQSCSKVDDSNLYGTDHEAIIIGSGYSGAVAALRLGESGVQTLVIEMGKYWNRKSGDKDFSTMLNPTKSSVWLRKKTFLPFGPPISVNSTQVHTGVLDRVEYDYMKIYVGRGVGGGSLVNGGMAVTPSRAFFEKMMPDVDANEMYNKYFPLANDMLEVNEIHDSLYNTIPYYKFSRVGEKEARKAGYETAVVPNVYNFSYMEQEYHNRVRRSALNNEVLYGNNAGKASVDKTYLPAAIATGNVTIKTLTRVDDITILDDGRYELIVTEINEQGVAIGSKTFRCQYLFMAAGTDGTNNLLLRARERGALPDLNSEIGTGWGPNGNIMCARTFIERNVGPLQATMPVRGILDPSNPIVPLFAELAPMPFGVETVTSLYLAVTQSTQRSYYYYDAATDSVKLNWPRSYSDEGVAAATDLMGKLIAENGGSISTLLFPDEGFSRDFTYHPLGGCILGKGSDLYGRVKGYNNLYVMDGSLIPGNISVNPFVTITALAERNIEEIIKSDIQI